MKKILSFLLLLSILEISAQEWAPIGAKWNFEVREAYSPSLRTYFQMESIADTFIYGKQCRLITGLSNIYFGGSLANFYTYEENNRVYYYNPTLQNFSLLYDFNMNSGDTYIVKYDTCDLLITVDSTSIDTVNGFPLKVQYTRSANSDFDGKVLQYIGNLSVPIPNSETSCYGTIIDGPYVRGLRCYEDSIIGSYQTPLAPYCDYITSVNEEYTEKQFSFNPNPASNSISLHFQNNNSVSLIFLSDTQGKTLKAYHSYQETIPLSDLPNGLYFLQIQLTNGQTRIRKIIKQ